MSNIKISDYSLGARWIHTMTGPPLERHFVNVSGGRIESFSARPAFGEVYAFWDDSGDEVQILPGTVNMHAHLELSQLAEPLEPCLFPEWIAELMRFRRGPQYDAVEGVWNALLRPELQSETVAVADIVPPDLELETMPPLKSPVWLAFRELIDWRGAPRAYTRGSFGLSPHAPQTVCPALLDAVVKTKVPVAMHLAETPEEIEFLRSGGGPLFELMRKADPDYDPQKVRLGKRPMDYLKLLSEAPQSFVIHGNYLDEEEIGFLAERRDTMAVVYCPRSHAYFGHREYPLKMMLDRGVRVLLGTDSLASSPDLSVIAEMKFLLDRHPEIPPETVFRMGTLHGAEALGLQNEFGVLQPGRPARFSFFEKRTTAGRKAYSPY